MPYTSLNGHMFSFLTESGAMAPRLPEDELAALLKKCRPWLRERHGTVLKDHAVVPASLLEKTADLAKWFLQSTKYVASLTPEATRKNTKAKKSTKAKKTARASKKQ